MLDYKLGLIGYPLSHSFSPAYFEQKFEKLGIKNSEYLAYPLDDISKVNDLFLAGVTGLNVTIPYKEKVIPYLDELSDAAKEIGAVNTIKIEGGKKVGYNTDVYGFEKSLLAQLGDTMVNKALILGTGGASKAVAYVLDKLGVKYQFVSRKLPFLTYGALSKDILYDHQLIVNTTPLGMYPNVGQCPDLPYIALSEKHFLYDLVYNPEKTLFLKNGESEGSSIKNGEDMLVLQAEKSWEIWSQK